MITIADIETAYKNAEWAEVISLLDDYYGDNLTPQYSGLRQTIQNALFQGLQLTVANLQALKMLINGLKKSEPKGGDEAYLASKRIPLTRSQENFYNYLVKSFPYHSCHKIITEYFKQGGLKTNAILIHGKSKEMPDIRKFNLITHHCLFKQIASEYDPMPPILLGYTLSHPYGGSEEGILGQILEHLEVPKSKIPTEEEEMEVLLSKELIARLEGKSLIIPYILAEKSKSKHYDSIKNFMEGYWKRAIKSVKEVVKSQFSLVFLIIIEDDSDDAHQVIKFEYLNDTISDSTIPENIKIAISGIDEPSCQTWIKQPTGLFSRVSDFKCFQQNWQTNPTAYLPDCGTIEGLLEKITEDIFPGITFPDLLKKAKSN